MKPSCKAIYSVVFFFLITLLLSSCLPTVKLPPEEKPSGKFTPITEFNGKSYGYEIVYDGEDYTSLTEEEQKQYVTTLLVEKTEHERNIVFKTAGILIFNPVESFGVSKDILYFSTGNETEGFSYYSYDTDGGLFKKIVEAPSSNMMVLGDDPSWGWIVTQSQIIAVDMDTGVIEESLAYTYETGELFFFKSSDTFEKKITRLSKLSDEKTLLLTVEFYETESSVYPERNYFYQFNTAKRMGYGPFGESAVN